MTYRDKVVKKLRRRLKAHKLIKDQTSQAKEIEATILGLLEVRPTASRNDVLAILGNHGVSPQILGETLNAKHMQ